MRWRLTVSTLHCSVLVGTAWGDREQLLHAVLQSCAPTVFVYVQFGTDNPTIKRFFIGTPCRDDGTSPLIVRGYTAAAAPSVLRSPKRWGQAMKPSASNSIFELVLIKPTHYDDDGYPITWLRSHIPSNTLAALYGLGETASSAECWAPTSTS